MLSTRRRRALVAVVVWAAWMMSTLGVPVAVWDVIGGELGNLTWFTLFFLLLAVQLKFQTKVADWILSGCPQREQWTEDSL